VETNPEVDGNAGVDTSPEVDSAIADVPRLPVEGIVGVAT